MASNTRNTKDLLRFLSQKAPQIDFYQAMRLIEACLGDEQTTHIKSLPALSFATNEVAKIAAQTHDDAQFTLTLWQTFVGLTGQNGVLPDHFTELLLQRLAAKDTALAAFLDIFNQRIAELFYDSWKLARFYVDFECDTQAAINNQMLCLLRSLGGLAQFQQQQQFEDLHIFYAGIFSQQVKSAEGLQRILQDHFEIPVHVNQYHGEWINIDNDEITALGSHPDHSFNARLGQSVTLGKRVWLAQNRFEITIGPLNYHRYCQLLPNGVMLAAVKKITQMYLGREYTFALKLTLRPQSVPKCRLTHKRTLRLGWNTWATTRKPNQVVAVTFGPTATNLIRHKLKVQVVPPSTKVKEHQHEIIESTDHQAEPSLS